MDTEACPIWGYTVRKSLSPGVSDKYIYHSYRAGGAYTMSDDVKEDIRVEIYSNSEAGNRIRVNTSSWICDQISIGVRYPLVTEEIIERSKSRQLPGFIEIKERFLKYFINSRPGSLEGFPSGSDEEFILMARIGVLNDIELSGVIELLDDMGLLKKTTGNNFKFSQNGFYEISLIDSIADSKEVFVAMWFDPSVNHNFESAIKPAIEACGYKAIRVDKTELNDKLDDQIIASIKRAKFLVADFTAQNFEIEGRRVHEARGGVYYEAGFAHGLGKSVIFMVEKSQINDIHFDTRQYNHIVYSSIEEARDRLIARINATINK